MELRGLFLIATIFVSTNDPQPTPDAGTNSNVVKCKAGTAVIGQSANVTCFFYVDLTINRHNFIIERYKYDGGTVGQTKEEILSCNLIQYDKPNCECKDEAQYNITRDCVTLEFANATRDISGLYVCHLIPGLGPAEPCSLTVKDATENGTDENCVNIDHGHATQLPENRNCAEQEESLASAWTIIIVLSVFTILETIALATIGVYYICKRKKNERQRGETGEINLSTESSIMMNSAYTPSPVEEATACNSTWRFN